MEGHQLLATKKTSLAIPPAIVAWLKQEYVIDRERSIPKERLYAAYENYCRHQLRMKPKDPNTFGKFVARVFPHVFTRRLGPISHQVTHYSGIGPRPAAPNPSPSSATQQQQQQQQEPQQQQPPSTPPARRRKTKQQQQQPVPYLPLPSSPYLHGLPPRNPHQPPPCSLNSPEGALLNLHYKPPVPHSQQQPQQQPQQQHQQQPLQQQSATEQHTPSSRKRKTPSPPPSNSAQQTQPAEQQPPLSRGLSDYSLSGDELHSSVSVSPSQQTPSPNSSPCPSPRCPVKEECDTSQHRLHYTSATTCSSSAPSSPLSLPPFSFIETPRPPRSMSFTDSYKAPPTFFENQHYYLFSNSNSYIYNRDNDHHSQHSYSNKRVKREEVSLREMKQEPVVLHSRRESMVIVEEREEEEPEWAFFVSSGPRTC